MRRKKIKFIKQTNIYMHNFNLFDKSDKTDKKSAKHNIELNMRNFRYSRLQFFYQSTEKVLQKLACQRRGQKR